MSLFSPFALLRSQRFFPLFTVQFFGSCNDNLLKNALITSLVYQFTLYQVASSPQWEVTLAAGLFILPFVFFSALAGEIADQVNKRNLIIWIKCLELFLVLIAVLGFYQHQLFLLLSTLFLMGVHSTFFGPIKYAILPELLKKDELFVGNALVESGTFIAILLGTLWGGFLVFQKDFVLWIGLAMGLLALIGLLASMFIPSTPQKGPAFNINRNILQSTCQLVQQVRQEKKVLQAIIGISWFWLVGSVFLTQLPNLTKDFLGVGPMQTPLLLVIFIIGIALGALFCCLFKKQRGMRWVPLSLLLMGLFLVDFYFAAQSIPSQRLSTQADLSLFLKFVAHSRICWDLIGIAFSGGIYIVPLYTFIQLETRPEYRARAIAANNIINSLFIVIAAVLLLGLLKMNVTLLQFFLCLGLATLGLAGIAFFLIPESLLKPALRFLLRSAYDVQCKGLKNYKLAGDRVVIVANHTSFLDVVLLYAFLPDNLLFAINRFTAKIWWIKPFLYFADVFELDPINPLALKTLIHRVKETGKCVIFPEGRITTTGTLMKIYEGPGLVADHAKALLLPIRIQGAQYTPFSRLRGKVRIRFFPKISLTILPPRPFSVDSALPNRLRRQQLAKQLYAVMVEMLFLSTDYQKTLFESLIEARVLHGGSTKILEDIQRTPISYDQLITRCFSLKRTIAQVSDFQEIIGLLLPTSVGTLTVFFALHAYGRVPAFLNYAAGSAQVGAACHLAQIRCVLTSRQFIEQASLFDYTELLRERGIELLYLEEIKQTIHGWEKLFAMIGRYWPSVYYQKTKKRLHPSDPAVVLFTSGSEGTPKGVVLSHENIQANLAQMLTQLDFNKKDIVFSALPLFHAFGLTAGVILPVLHGIKTFLYPSPLHYRKVPNAIYDCNATITFGTDTFLAGYGQFAHPYDFYSIRYVFAGGEKLKEKTRVLWMEKFGLRIFEGYGVTEASPVISCNTPMRNKPGTAGHFLPGIRYKIKKVSSLQRGGRLFISGPNVMLGYLSSDAPGKLTPLPGGWHDTGDIVSLDEGYLQIIDRVKRFAKIGGEMLSLAGLESAIYELWPHCQHALVNLPDSKKGECLILVTEYEQATRHQLSNFYRTHGLPELGLPRQIFYMKNLPLLSTGKVNYPIVKQWVTERLAE